MTPGLRNARPGKVEDSPKPSSNRNSWCHRCGVFCTHIFRPAPVILRFLPFASLYRNRIGGKRYEAFWRFGTWCTRRD